MGVKGCQIDLCVQCHIGTISEFCCHHPIIVTTQAVVDAFTILPNCSKIALQHFYVMQKPDGFLTAECGYSVYYQNKYFIAYYRYDE